MMSSTIKGERWVVGLKPGVFPEPNYKIPAMEEKADTVGSGLSEKKGEATDGNDKLQKIA